MRPMPSPSRPGDGDAGSRRASLERTIQAIRERCGPGAIMRLGGDARADVAAISTGALSLDLALGIGGIPRGRITEIFGPESSGKTTLALHVIANAQRGGGVAAMIDAEHALDPSYARRVGVDTDELLVSQPDYGEQALEIVEMLASSETVDVIVVDSVAALVPKAELEGEMGETFVGLQARLMSQALRKLTGIVHRAGAALVFINQLREKIGVLYGNPETTPGGRALKFHTSVRIDLRRLHALRDGDRHRGNRVRVKVVKNKLAPPFRQTELDILFDRGIDRRGDLLDLAVDLGVVRKVGGGWLEFRGDRIGHGRERTLAFLDEEPELLTAIEGALAELARSEPDGELSP